MDVVVGVEDGGGEAEGQEGDGRTGGDDGARLRG